MHKSVNSRNAVVDTGQATNTAEAEGDQNTGNYHNWPRQQEERQSAISSPKENFTQQQYNMQSLRSWAES